MDLKYLFFISPHFPFIFTVFENLQTVQGRLWSQAADSDISGHRTLFCIWEEGFIFKLGPSQGCCLFPDLTGVCLYEKYWSCALVCSLCDAVCGMKPTQSSSAEKEVSGQLIPLTLERMSHSLGVLFLCVDMTECLETQLRFRLPFWDIFSEIRWIPL